MFETGDLIIYGNSGVCKVAQVGTPNVKAFDQTKLYYTLQPLYSTETIYTPVDTDVFMRPVISRSQAEELIHQIPSIREVVCKDRNLTMLRGHYEATLNTHECKDLVQLIKSVYSKNMDAAQNGKKPGQVDLRYMKRAEELLYGELAVALDIPKEGVLSYIENAVEFIEQSG